MAVMRMDNVGMELEGRGHVEGAWVDGVIGLQGADVDIAMMRSPDGHSRLELSKFNAPEVIPTHPDPRPVNALGLLRVMFTVDDVDATVARLQASHGAELVGTVENYEDVYRLCYIRGPEGILIGLAEELGE